jgi:hypothetical protein
VDDIGQISQDLKSNEVPEKYFDDRKLFLVLPSAGQKHNMKVAQS